MSFLRKPFAEVPKYMDKLVAIQQVYKPINKQQATYTGTSGIKSSLKG